MESRKNPRCVLLFSGKRKSGKDYFTDRLLEACKGEDIVVIKISAPIKSHFARNHNLNLKELMGDGLYKENYRKEMIDWSEEMRRKDPGVFCRHAIEMYNAEGKRVWIVSDVRRKTDVKWFKENFGNVVKTIRIEASCDIRKDRGWRFESGVDDVSSECDLDDYNNWDWKFENNGEKDKINEALNTICEYLKKMTMTYTNYCRVVRDIEEISFMGEIKRVEACNKVCQMVAFKKHIILLNLLLKSVVIL